MTIEERVSRLEGVVEKLASQTTEFVKASMEFNATVTGAIQTLATTVADQGRRLDEIVRRFDEWLRGQGPRDGSGS